VQKKVYDLGIKRYDNRGSTSKILR
jgi:hypothetical protein